MEKRVSLYIKQGDLAAAAYFCRMGQIATAWAELEKAGDLNACSGLAIYQAGPGWIKRGTQSRYTPAKFGGRNWHAACNLALENYLRALGLGIVSDEDTSFKYSVPETGTVETCYVAAIEVLACGNMDARGLPRNKMP